MLQPLIFKFLQQTCRFMSLFILANESQTMKHIHILQIFFLSIFTLVLIQTFHLKTG